MSQLGVVNLGAIGSYGLNTQSTPIDLPAQFATETTNSVIDEGGKLSARKSVTLYTTANATLLTNNVNRVYRHNNLDGTSTLVCAGANNIFTVSGTTLTSRLSGATNNRWQFASLNGKLFAAQTTHNFTQFTEGGSWTSATISTPDKPNCIHAAYGRLWAANITSNDYTLYWSILNNGTDFTGAGSGSLDLRGIFINGKDSIVGIASHNRRIIVFCQKSIYVLGLAEDLNPGNSVRPIYLEDSLANIGCVARDSIVSTGDDIFFLSDDGLRTLQRSLQGNRQLPLTDASVLNNQKTVTEAVNGNTTADIVGAYWPQEAWYILILPTSKEVWVYDISNKVPDIDVPRMTVWGMSNRPIYCAAFYSDNLMYFGGASGLYRYSTFDATDAYRFTISTGWLSLGDPSSLKHFKKVVMNIRGGSAQSGFIKWKTDFNENQTFSAVFTLGANQTTYYYGVAEYNISEYSSGVLIDDIYTQIGNSAKFIKFTIDIPIQGSAISLNNMQAFVTKGRVR